ncbi:MAG TPA: hemerythrin domain-containing protein [Terriglobales bacterium]|nr:hemerythrin domain-containing protein [Terriglobales bacterium]
MSSTTLETLCSNNRREHENYRRELQRLQVALESLSAYCEPVANLRSLRDVTTELQFLAAGIPTHMAQEERTVLDPFAQLGSEQARFAEAMKEQHNVLRKRLAHFSQLLHEIHDSSNLCRALIELKEQGKEFASFLLQHIKTEELELAEFASIHADRVVRRA